MRKSVKICLSALAASGISAAAPVYVDLDMNGRQSSEVTEPNYTRWVIDSSATFKTGGITFSLSSSGTIKSNWYKAGVSSPSYARLVCDGVQATTDLTLKISGLSSGSHTLLAYLNNVDGTGKSSITVTGGSQTLKVTSTDRALSTDAAAYAFINFSGTSATLKFAAASLVLNGFLLDVTDPNSVASSPSPADLDDHASASGNSITLTWKAASSAASHNVYFGTDSSAVLSAKTSGAEYKGKQTGTSYKVTGVTALRKYFWRIDEVAANGTVTAGPVWRFRTATPAFEGAEGYGGTAIGGRGGKVVYVTNLNDSGSGSLREAVENDIGPRTILFKVSGVINLKSRLVLSSSYVTVAGQSAPGKGITIYGAPFGITGNECIVRFIRVRRGYGNSDRGLDGMGITGANHSILDHASISWTTDEAFSSRNGKNLTLQRTFISEALNIADHPNYPAGTEHGYAGSIGGDVGSFHHNLLAHNEGRNWSMAGGLDGNGYYAGRLDIFNNVVYNWRGRVTDGGAHEVNFVGNYYKAGAASKVLDYVLRADIEAVGLGSQAYYFHNNILELTGSKKKCDGTDDACGRSYTNAKDTIDWTLWNSKPFFASSATVQSAGSAYKDVLSDVGVNSPVLDDHDIRVINEVKKGTYTYKGSISGYPGLPDRESDVGGLENYGNATWDASYDSDSDGLPDWWEKVSGVTDANADPDGTGYTELERFLDWMARPHFTVETGKTLEIDLSAYTRGYDNPSYSVSGVPSGAKATVSGSKLSVTLDESVFGGAQYLTFTAKDAAGDTFTRKIGIRGSAETSKPTGIAAAAVPQGNISFEEQGDRLLISGLAGNASIAVYSINGSAPMTAKTLTAQAGNAILDLAPYGRGVYMILVKSAGATGVFRISRR